MIVGKCLRTVAHRASSCRHRGVSERREGTRRAPCRESFFRFLLTTQKEPDVWARKPTSRGFQHCGWMNCAGASGSEIRPELYRSRASPSRCNASSSVAPRTAKIKANETRIPKWLAGGKSQSGLLKECWPVILQRTDVQSTPDRSLPPAPSSAGGSVVSTLVADNRGYHADRPAVLDARVRHECRRPGWRYNRGHWDGESCRGRRE